MSVKLQHVAACLLMAITIGCGPKTEHRTGNARRHADEYTDAERLIKYNEAKDLLKQADEVYAHAIVETMRAEGTPEHAERAEFEQRCKVNCDWLKAEMEFYSGDNERLLDFPQD